MKTKEFILSTPTPEEALLTDEIRGILRLQVQSLLRPAARVPLPAYPWKFVRYRASVHPDPERPGRFLFTFRNPQGEAEHISLTERDAKQMALGQKMPHHVWLKLVRGFDYLGHVGDAKFIPYRAD